MTIRSTGASHRISPGQNLQQATVTDGIPQVECSTAMHTTLLIVPHACYILALFRAIQVLPKKILLAKAVI